uniref:Uncharacterized protein n=1 Tax=Anguilla anguilla TaxID=7936 RepID=A0A0E9Y0Z4_ANGAN
MLYVLKLKVKMMCTINVSRVHVHACKQDALKLKISLRIVPNLVTLVHNCMNLKQNS